MFKKIKSKTSDDTTRQKRLTEEDLENGDHIYVRRRGLLYSHHGIYAGERTVIHFKGEDKEKQDPAVILTEIDKFLCGGKLKKRHSTRLFDTGMCQGSATTLLKRLRKILSDGWVDPHCIRRSLYERFATHKTLRMLSISSG